MNKTRFLVLAIIPTLLLVGCNKKTSSSSEPEPPVVNYVDKEVDFYREKDTPDKKFSLRFYNELPNVPYVSVSAYFKEFFKRELHLDKQGFTYYYINANNDYLGFDTEHNEFICNGLQSFSSHPDFPSSNSKVFLRVDGVVGTTRSIRNVNLNNYHIKLFDGDTDAYVPISLLSSLAGGQYLYDIAYNGKDLYMIDWGGEFGEEKPTSYYGDAYKEILDDTTTTRPRDLADYTYGELCFNFDNLRGYTEQLVFGDNNLVTLGLNGLLEQYHPKIKEYLLSLDKNDYYEGLNALFYGLYDGVHTSDTYIVELDKTMSKTIGKEIFLSRPTEKWERYDVDPYVWNEGPNVLFHNGKYYLTYSAHHFIDPNYCVGCSISNMITGPYIKTKEGPILKRVEGVIHGPGHSAFLKDIDGKDLIVYHVQMDLKDGNKGRKACISPVIFDGDKIKVDYQ